MAAANAEAVFSTMPLFASCRPRCATGRAISQSRLDISYTRVSGDFEYSFHLHGRVVRQYGDADGGPRVPALVTEHRHHHVGCAVKHLRSFQEGGDGVDEPAEPD